MNKKVSVAKLLLKFRMNQVDLFNIINISSPVAFGLAQQMHQFINILDTLVLNLEDDDILWPPSEDNSFPVKTYYTLINDGGLRSQYRLHIWKSCASLKIKIFAWLVTHNKILSRENFVKK